MTINWLTTKEHGMTQPAIATIGTTAGALPSAAQMRALQAAEQTGLTPDLVERLPFDLSALTDEGIFLNVDAQGFGLLDRRLDWRALGVALPHGTDLAFRPPRCGLLPDRYRLPLLRPAARAHATLHRYSYRFTLTETLFETPAYRWVPWRAFPAFEAEFDAARRALEQARSAALRDYDAVREEVVAAVVRLATDSARRLAATGQAVPSGFADAVLQGVLSAMPSRDELRTRLTLRFRVGVVLLGSEMLAEQRAAVAERSRLEAVAGEAALDRQQRAARERAIQAELWAEEERIRRKLAAEEEERRREAELKERLRTLKLEAARERMAEAVSPLVEGARQLHAAVYEAAAALRTALTKHGHLPGASSRRAQELVRWYRLMNFQSEPELDTLLAELERRTTRGTARRTRPETGALEDVLSDIIARCYADARAAAEPHRMGAIEV